MRTKKWLIIACYPLFGCSLGPSQEEIAKAQNACEYVSKDDNLFPQELVRFAYTENEAEQHLDTFSKYVIDLDGILTADETMTLCVAIFSGDTSRVEEFDSKVAEKIERDLERSSRELEEAVQRYDRTMREFRN